MKALYSWYAYLDPITWGPEKMNCDSWPHSPSCCRTSPNGSPACPAALHSLTLPQPRPASLTASRTAANAIYVVPLLQAEMDDMSGSIIILCCEEADYSTACRTSRRPSPGPQALFAERAAVLTSSSSPAHHHNLPSHSSLSFCLLFAPPLWQYQCIKWFFSFQDYSVIFIIPTPLVSKNVDFSKIADF